jgi:hypothetical protein
MQFDQASYHFFLQKHNFVNITMVLNYETEQRATMSNNIKRNKNVCLQIKYLFISSFWAINYHFNLILVSLLHYKENT